MAFSETAPHQLLTLPRQGMLLLFLTAVACAPREVTVHLSWRTGEGESERPEAWLTTTQIPTSSALVVSSTGSRAFVCIKQAPLVPLCTNNARASQDTKELLQPTNAQVSVLKSPRKLE
eukprot:1139951-Pelagomonas_calceolata.AAC.4